MVNQPAAVRIVSWFLLIVSGFVLAARFLASRSGGHAFAWDDICIVASLLFNIVTGVLVGEAANYGLGRPLGELQAHQIDIYQKVIYAANVLSIPTLCLAKLSIVVFYRRLFGGKESRQFNLGLGIFICTWGIASIFAALFECSTPATWNRLSGNTCIDLIGFWRYNGIVNILTDLSLMAFPFYTVVPLNMSARKKTVVLLCFCSRLLDVAATATQLGYSGNFGKSDITLALWEWYLVGQCTQTIAILTSCVPYIRILTDAFPESFFKSTFSKMPYGERTVQTASYVLRDVGRSESDANMTGGSGNGHPNGEEIETQPAENSDLVVSMSTEIDTVLEARRSDDEDWAGLDDIRGTAIK